MEEDRPVDFSTLSLKLKEKYGLSKEKKILRLIEARCALRGSTQQLTQTDADTHCSKVDGAWGCL